MFANDLSLFVGDAVVVQYADDIELLVSDPKSQLHHTVARLEHVLASLDDWLRSNGLKVNAEKTQLMLLGSRQNLRTVPHFAVKFRDHSLFPCSEARNLGLVFDRTFSWNSHVALVSKRCFGMLTGLSHLKHSLSDYVLITLVNALVLSQVRYCLSVYVNGSKLSTSRLQKILNFAAKLIFGRKKYDHVSDLHERLGWLTAADLGRLHTITLTHKILRSGELTRWPVCSEPWATCTVDRLDKTVICLCLVRGQRWENAVSPSGRQRYIIRCPATFDNSRWPLSRDA